MLIKKIHAVPPQKKCKCSSIAAAKSKKNSNMNAPATEFVKHFHKN
jgi:hypothetical protein